MRRIGAQPGKLRTEIGILIFVVLVDAICLLKLGLITLNSLHKLQGFFVSLTGLHLKLGAILVPGLLVSLPLIVKQFHQLLDLYRVCLLESFILSELSIKISTDRVPLQILNLLPQSGRHFTCASSSGSPNDLKCFLNLIGLDNLVNSGQLDLDCLLLCTYKVRL